MAADVGEMMPGRSATIPLLHYGYAVESYWRHVNKPNALIKRIPSNVSGPFYTLRRYQDPLDLDCLLDIGVRVKKG
jgi:hypothetical protein